MLTALFVVTGLWSSQDKFDFSRDFSRFLEGLCRFLEYFRDFPGLCRWWVTLWEASRRVLLHCPVKMEICLEGNIFKKELGWNSWYEGHDMIPHEMVTKMYLWRDRQQEGNNEDISDTGDRRSTASGFHKFGRRCEPDRDNYEEENIKHALKDTTETFPYHYHQITTNITMTMITTNPSPATSITIDSAWSIYHLLPVLLPGVLLALVEHQGLQNKHWHRIALRLKERFTFLFRHTGSWSLSSHL